MPFSTTATTPDTNARVTVKFAGLMLLKPNASNGCDIGIHRRSDTHTLQVIVVVSRPDRPPTLIRLVTGPLNQPFAINVTPDPGTGVRAFERGPEPFDRSSTRNSDLDFRWAIDMQEYHPGVDFNDGARPIATLNAGTLYTPNLTRVELSPELVRGTTRKQLHRFSADLAAAIDLPGAMNRVELSWRVESGERRTLNLPRRNDPRGTTYTVTFLNDPPVINAAAHDELAHYYDVLEVKGSEIPPDDRFSMAITLGDPTTDEIPCMPVVINPPVG